MTRTGVTAVTDTRDVIAYVYKWGTPEQMIFDPKDITIVCPVLGEAIPMTVPAVAARPRHTHAWGDRDSDDAECLSAVCRLAYGEYRAQVQRERDRG